MLAYYYIWFDARAWSRDKIDYPQLGRYDSSDVSVIRQHVRWAKDAGVKGFIVSWRRTRSLDPRLAQLVEVAAEERFKLVVIYQGLDFQRSPRAAETITSDLVWFADRYGRNDVFDLFGRPTVIISGTESYSTEELDRITTPVRRRLNVLGTEKSVDGYERISRIVDGNAYYWSSVDPVTYKNYEGRLSSMARAVHDDDGLWIAPAAPGFDSRLLDKPTVVPRRNGATLRREVTAALSSDPDALGIISWNEFSENTHVEPSERYGTRSLDVLSEMLGGKPTTPHTQVNPSLSRDRVFDDPEATGGQPGWGGLRAIVTFGALLMFVSFMLVRSRRRHRSGNAFGGSTAGRST